MNRLIRLMWVVLFLPGYLVGAGQEVADTVHIREIRVLAGRKLEEAGLKVTRPDSVQRMAFLTTDLSELISVSSPVFIKSYGIGSPAMASFRGTSASHTQVFWNGMNLNSPMRGVADLALLPVFFTDDVYLLHGGSSLSEGSGGLGGSIHLSNQPDWSSKLNIKAIAEAGSFRHRKSFIKVEGGGNRFRTGTRLFCEVSENNFPFFNTGVIPHRKDTLKNADFRKTGFLQEFYFRPFSDQIFTLRFWGQKSRRNLPQLMSYEGSPREEYQDDQLLRGQMEWKKYGDNGNIHWTGGINSTRLTYYRATPEFNFVNEDSDSREFSLFNRLRISQTLNETISGAIGLTANYHRVNVHTKTQENGYREDRLETSLLLRGHFKPSGRFLAFALIRAETYDKEIVPLIPALGMEWQLFSNLPLTLHSNLARNYHKPALNDLYWIPGGNPELLPEEGFSGDITLSGAFRRDKLTFTNEITGFLSKIDNWIIWQPASNGAYYWEANNVQEVLSQGLEYSFSSELAWKKFRFRWGGNYAYTHTYNLNAVSSVDRSRGKQLIYIPKHKGHVYFSTDWKNFIFKYDLGYTGKRFTRSGEQASDYERVLNPYWLNKALIGKKIFWKNMRFDLKFSVENVFDEDYQSILWRPMPGRFYHLSAAFSYKK